MIKYSFVIPSYQSKRMLKNTLEALNNQEGFGKDDYEVIVVDDGSTDDTYSYIDGINRNYKLKYIYLDRCPDSCRSRARNHGIREAAGDIVIFIDADIIVKKDYLREVSRYYQVEENMVLVGPRLMLPEDVAFETVQNGKIFEKYFFDIHVPELHEFRHRVFSVLSYNAASIAYPFVYGQSCNLIAPKKLLLETGGFDEDFKAWGVEDVEAVCKLWKLGAKFLINSKLEVLHQFHGKESPIVEDYRAAGCRENTRLFLLKHKNVFGISEEKVYELFQSIALNFRYVEKEPSASNNQIALDFMDKESLQDMKDIITLLSDKENLNMIVYDHIEDTDLDIWIQLLGKRSSTPRYMPVSKKLNI